MVAIIMAAVIFMCGPTAGGFKHGWASWYASPIKSHKTYNNPWYTRGKNPVMNYAAVNSFKYGDNPYYIEVCAERTQKCTIAKVVDHCSGCTGKRLVDLSPLVWKELGVPLWRGVVEIIVRRCYGNQGSAYRGATERSK